MKKLYALLGAVAMMTVAHAQNTMSATLEVGDYEGATAMVEGSYFDVAPTSFYLAHTGTQMIYKAEDLAPLGVVSLFANINTARNNVILSDRFQLIYGSETLSDTLCGLEFRLSPGAFFQVNPSQTEKLYETALRFAGLTPEDTLCDVYCGAGTITLMMARHCRSAVGIEIVPAAVENARENAKRNGIPNAEFHAGKAEELLPRMVRDGLRCNVIVVDPPRKGLEPEVIRAIAEAGPDRVVYVSCNVATQARDAALFREAGYSVRKVQPVDMFCWTSGIESVALFCRDEENPSAGKEDQAV